MPASYSWTLVTPAATPAQSTSATPSPGVRRARFQSMGLLVPLARDQKNDFANDSGEALAVAKVLQVLGTKPGELDWHPAFGCDLHRARHKNNTPMLQAMIRLSIQDAFVKWMPSLALLGVDMTAKGRELYIQVRFNERTAAGKRFAEDLTVTVPLPIAA